MTKKLMKIAKLGKINFIKLRMATITTDVLLRICNVLDYNIYEIVECVKI